MPTYKFDPFSEIYDTSKKQRCPAWWDYLFLFCEFLSLGAIGSLYIRIMLPNVI